MLVARAYAEAFQCIFVHEEEAVQRQGMNRKDVSDISLSPEASQKRANCGDLYV